MGVGCKLAFLPPYSPDFNPIEESFSSCESALVYDKIYADNFLVKAYFRRHFREMMSAEFPEIALLEACGHITGNLACGWFQHSGYCF